MVLLKFVFHTKTVPLSPNFFFPIYRRVLSIHSLIRVWKCFKQKTSKGDFFSKNLFRVTFTSYVNSFGGDFHLGVKTCLGMFRRKFGHACVQCYIWVVPPGLYLTIIDPDFWLIPLIHVTHGGIGCRGLLLPANTWLYEIETWSVPSIGQDLLRAHYTVSKLAHYL